MGGEQLVAEIALESPTTYRQVAMRFILDTSETKEMGTITNAAETLEDEF